MTLTAFSITGIWTRRAVSSFFALCLAVLHTGTSAAQTSSNSAATGGILPSLSALLPADSPLVLRFPATDPADDAGTKYARRFPIGGQAAVDRGITLPKPWGVSVTLVENNQFQEIENISVALGKGSPPPSGTTLVDLPFVSIENAESQTTSRQIRADLWVLPFLNVFGSLGEVDGRVPLDVVVDLDQTGLCPPLVTCDTVSASFVAGVDTYTATLGLTGVYGWHNWYVTGSGSATFSFGGDTEDAIRSYSASTRLGRRWAYGPGHIVSPFIGVSYLHLDQIVEGTTRLPDAFPDGDSLDLRYRARISNEDKWSGILGLNLGFIQGFAIAAELNFNDSSDRAVLSATYRF